MNRMKKVIWAHFIILIILLSFSMLAFAGQAKNVILMIGDGMGPAHLHITWLYATRHLGKNLVMTEIMDKGQTAYMINDTADSTVTESAAAAVQMATGVKVLAKSIGIGPDGRVLKTILEMAKEKGKATGLITTSGITDATPAGFVAHVAHRSEEERIAEQLVRSDVNVLFRGRKAFFIPESEKGKRKDGRNLLNEARKNGYEVVETGEEMKRARGEKILGLFNMGNMLFEIDRKGSKEPSLAEMTAKALEVLGRKEQGFFMMVEGGRIDHAAHYYDIGAVISDVLAFDEAVRVAYDFQKANPDTLLIITADHETGGLVVLPYTPTSKEYEGINLEAISKIKGSYLGRDKELGGDPSSERIKEVMKKYYDIDLTEEQVRVIRENPLRQLDPRHFSKYGNAAIASVLRLHHRVGWATDSHTGSPLFLWGIGPGAEKIKGWRHNTELFRIMKEAYGF
ncbi:MAG: alkaline phosphatase [Syntrophaceae bacterium]|nr:alkaline phosphatase [Syntrophaceae bacterium]